MEAPLILIMSKSARCVTHEQSQNCILLAQRSASMEYIFHVSLLLTTEKRRCVYIIEYVSTICIH